MRVEEVRTSETQGQKARATEDAGLSSPSLALVTKPLQVNFPWGGAVMPSQEKPKIWNVQGKE